MNNYDVPLDLETENSLSLMLHQIRANSTILEFGPAMGRMTKYLSEQLNCNVYIVEIDEAAFESASKYSTDGICCDIETLEWVDKFAGMHFDYILFADVLEHLKEPASILGYVLQLLTYDGKVLASIPNIAHNSVIIDLIKNKFDYTNNGLLDRTHLRFFTYDSAYKLFEENGFKIVNLLPVYNNVGETIINNSYDEISLNLQKELKNRPLADVYQYVITALSLSFYENNKELIKVEEKIETGYAFEKTAIYYDSGKGFSENEKIIVNRRVHADGSFQITRRDISISNVKSLRFDICNYPCICVLENVVLNGILTTPASTNAIVGIDNVNYFLTNNPFYVCEVPSSNAVTSLSISGKLFPLYCPENLDKLLKRLEEIRSESVNSVRVQMQKENDICQQDYQNLHLKLQNENMVLLDTNKHLESENLSLHEKICSLDEHIQSIKENLAVKEQETHNLNEYIQKANEELAIKERENSFLCDEVQSQNLRIQEAMATSEAIKKELSITQQEIISSRQLLDQSSLTLAERERHIHYLEQYLYDIQHSTSWRITAPIRGAKNAVKVIINKRNIRQGLRKAYLVFPLPFRIKKRMKDIIFTIFSPFLRNTQTHKIWSHRNDAPELDAAYIEGAGENKISLNDKIAENYIQQIMAIPFEKGMDSEYVDDIPDLAPLQIRNDDMKYIAFYLPQYHPFPENDEWWGKGFTEWTNVTKAVPQFAGHYQPRLAGELGYYDLRNIETLKSQIKLAKRYGIYGFCLYYYWFDGKTLMEDPLKTILSNPELDLPFCLCWANENWSRRWDGKENDILISQNYTSDFPLKFIKSISAYMKDSRYIRLKEKPLFIVYNANQIPDLSNTLKIWRQYIREQGLGELHLLAVDFALTPESKRAGFDGFIEFPPHSLYTYSMPLLNKEISFVDDRCNSQIYDYQQIVREKKYLKQDIDHYYKGICMAWDNTARKPYSATVYHNYSVSAFKEWLKDISLLTKKTHSQGDRFVFINAWNEWAEGTYLEPDRKFGYANLKSVRNILLSMRSEQKKIIYVGHDAWFAGAQMLALRTILELNQTYHYQVYTVLKDTGSMIEKFQAASEDLFVYNPKEKEQFLLWAANTGAGIALCNTVVTGDVLSLLAQNGITCISMIHEMEQVIHQYSCEKQLSLINKYASKIVFASNYVKSSVDNIEQIIPEKSVIAPQGMFLVNTYLTQRDKIRHEIRQRYGLRNDSRIVLGVGYGYRRKGTDIFLKMAIKMCTLDSRIAFMWVGDLDTEMQGFASNLLEKATCSKQIILAGSQQDLMRYYTAADIFTLTSREDPFPSVVMEALYSYLPVIAFDGGGGYVDIISDKNGCLVPMENADMMMSEIEKLVNTPDLLMQKGKQAHQTITQRFNFISYIGKLLGLLGDAYESVSVVIPNYNYAKYLPMRIESVLQQTYPVQEIIILDDKSTDESREIIQMYQRKYPIKIRTIFNDTNSGNVFEQWKRGFDAAAGKYIWVAEADDLAEANFLETLISKMSSNDVVMSYSESAMINEVGKKIGENYQPWVSDIDDALWKNDFVMSGDAFVANALSVKNVIPNVSAVLFRKQDFTAALDYAKDYHVAGDWMFYVQILQGKGKIAFSSLPLNYHRRHSSSVTTELKAQQHFDEICSVQQYVAQIYYEGKLPQKAITYREEAKNYLNIKS